MAKKVLRTLVKKNLIALAITTAIVMLEFVVFCITKGYVPRIIHWEGVASWYVITKFGILGHDIAKIAIRDLLPWRKKKYITRSI